MSGPELSPTPPPSPEIEPEPEAEGNDFLVGFGAIVVGIVLAVVPHTHWWNPDPDATGRRSGLERLAASVDPNLISLVCGLLVLFGLWLVVGELRDGRKGEDG
ncbi:MAG TPA: hypothetical protein PLZ93_09425 [Nocardioides sp.]|uniref:hypothetical protein n=1 Tax=uncultured Nocardioides sp. TaxID=198441 RepID=UPI00261867F2|nr:hypothetical protein [uncultured Nocardioides sp.]HRD62614.1 hypothetical protein [Nocardioides sp.]HRI95821.1 hypothetical protein [Nocardioides sp.]HRK45960.1 hypothetical protein [Nocardioides sp.]